jgi:hypothetical protein
MFFVDEARWPYRGSLYCHLATDGTVEELHLFAERLGLRRSYFQNHASVPHYDLSPTKRRLALSLGAVSVDSKTLVKLARKGESR